MRRFYRASVAFSLQSWLGESEESKKTGTPGYFSVGMSCKALIRKPVPHVLVANTISK
jgi:hypothetical protein